MTALAPSHAPLRSYPDEKSRVGRGMLISLGVHLFVAGLVCLVLFLLGIQSLKELLDKGGAIASSGPAPEQMVVELKLDDIKPPPTDHIEFIQQVLKPKPVVVVPKPPPKPVPKTVVVTKPHFTAPNAHGSGNSNAVSSARVGNSGLPHPSYPYQALSNHITGTVEMHVVFDASGGVSSAEVVGSSGSGVLDAWTRTFIYAHWKNAGLANTSATVPVVYELP